ncbi:hypothetical protein HS088_TW06G00666 [Tripterygium wilfordii]|uniref:Pentatricopeptide repeat-containing protein n=1 Tax=Tripterygium wilfordii TaxID=458696 RepID=A0A7J7DJF9_TRIWF|nr:hypothetical protein HS088_TW06G00666 [Tripterygium wilfordii]
MLLPMLPQKPIGVLFLRWKFPILKELALFIKKRNSWAQKTSLILTFLRPEVYVGNSDDEVFQFLMHDQLCNAIPPSHDLIEKMLHCFKDDWKSALGIFRWAESSADYKHTPQAYDTMVDMLGKAKLVDRVKALLKEICRHTYHVWLI